MSSNCFDNKFWTVFVSGTNGRYGLRHDSRFFAEQEAERLANVGHKDVYVLECVAIKRVPETPVETITF